MNGIIIPGFALILFLFSFCNQQLNEKERKAINEEMKSRDIKQVKDADIIAAAFEQGRIIADTSQKLLFAQLLSAIQTEGVSHAIEFCKVSAYPLVDSLSKYYNAMVKRVSVQFRNTEDSPNQMEKEILEAYQFNMENNLELMDNVQMLQNDYLLYSKPIVINNGLCLNCHGIIGEQLLEENYNLLKSLYPSDKATGYQIGDLRGMWSIKLSKKELVKSL